MDKLFVSSTPLPTSSWLQTLGAYSKERQSAFQEAQGGPTVVCWGEQMKDKHCVKSKKHWASLNPRKSETREWTVMFVVSVIDFVYCLPENLSVSWSDTSKKSFVCSLGWPGLKPCIQTPSSLSYFFWHRDVSSNGPGRGKLQDSAAMGGQWRLPRLSAACLQTTLLPPNLKSSHSPSPSCWWMFITWSAIHQLAFF